MKNLLENKYVYLVVSFIIAIWLFLSVSAPGSLSTRDNTSKQFRETASKVEVVKNIPVQVTADNEKYFITGYPSTVDVTLRGPAALVETTKKTKNFRVYLDLTNLGTGKHKVELKQRDLNKQIKYDIKPRFVTVDIQPKAEKVMPIQIEYDKDIVKDGYITETPKASPDTVKVSGAENEVARVTQVIAKVDIPKGTTSDIDREVLLQALDSEGKIVNVVLGPQTTHITIPIKAPNKTVGIKLKQSGTEEEGFKYDFSSEVNELVAYGPQSVLDNLSNIEIPVDVSGIKYDTKKVIDLKKVLDEKIWNVNPKTVTVTIKVNREDENSVN